VIARLLSIFALGQIHRNIGILSGILIEPLSPTFRRLGIQSHSHSTTFILSEDPSPDERAEYVILRLEQFIREGRSINEGMSFKTWKSMAKVNIANAITEAELDRQREEVISRRLLSTLAGALVTVGFWGTAFSLQNVGYLAAGIACGLAGLSLMAIAGEWRFRIWNKTRKANNRRKSLVRVESINYQIKRLEGELEKEKKSLNDKIKTLVEATK
jgi:hypothetical protein